MFILNPTKIQELKEFTDLTKSNLIQANLFTLGDILNLSPRKIVEYEKFFHNNTIEADKNYFGLFTIQSRVIKTSQRGVKYMLLSLLHKHKIYTAYLFQLPKFVINKALPGTEIMAFFSAFNSQNSFKQQEVLVLRKINFLSASLNISELPDFKFDIFYPKLSTKVDSTFLKKIHSKLNEKQYLINLDAICPKELFNLAEFDQNSINLMELHKPKSLKGYFKAKNNLIKLKVYTNSILYKYYNFEIKKNSEAVTPKLNLEWVQESVQKLPMELTKSQKVAIWEILQDTTIVESKEKS